jgi:hypothetical protein
MKNFIFGFLFGFSFFVTRWMLNIATTSIASQPYAWMSYLVIPLLISVYYITEEVK